MFGFLLGFIRILAGGHFLSDIVFSCIFGLVLCLFRAVAGVVALHPAAPGVTLGTARWTGTPGSWDR